MTRAWLFLFTVAVLLTSAAHHARADLEPDDDGTVVPNLHGPPTFTVSTLPPNGDINPYGVAFVPAGFPAGGPLNPGDILVSNFNNSNNQQGTGTTIVRIDSLQQTTLFFQDRARPGLDTALGVLEAGFVLVGRVPSTNGKGICRTGPQGQQLNVGAGNIIVIDRQGNRVQTISDPHLLDGPWDMTIEDEGSTAVVFVSNVLSGTVTRLDLRIQDGPRPVTVENATQIASGYLHRCDSSAFVVGPTGLALDASNDLLYVASTGDNAIFAISEATQRQSDAGMGTIVVHPDQLHGPLGLVLAPNGNLVSAQGDAENADPANPSLIMEFTPAGGFVDQVSIDGAVGGAFGIAIQPAVDGFTFAAVDDNAVPPVLKIWVVD